MEMTQNENHRYKTPKAQFVPVVVGGRLIFKFDPTRGLIEYQSRGEKHIIDLADYASKGDEVGVNTDQADN